MQLAVLVVVVKVVVQVVVWVVLVRVGVAVARGVPRGVPRGVTLRLEVLQLHFVVQLLPLLRLLPLLGAPILEPDFNLHRRKRATRLETDLKAKVGAFPDL